MGPDVTLPTPLTKVKIDQTKVGVVGSSPIVSNHIAPTDAREMMDIIRDQSPVKLNPSIPNVKAKTTSTAELVPNPQRSKQDNPEPRQDTMMT